MAFDEWTQDRPMLVPLDFKTRFTSPCEQHPDGFEWYKGTGIVANEHPLAKYIPFKGCANCDNDDVLVIAAQWNVNMMNGDEYWDYEIECQQCRKYTKRSFADND